MADSKERSVDSEEIWCVRLIFHEKQELRDGIKKSTRSKSFCAPRIQLVFWYT